MGPGQLGWRVLGILVVSVAVVAAGCGDEGAEGAKDSSGLIKRVDVVTKGGDFRAAVDATPAPDGGVVYFTAKSSKGPGVFKVPSSGGDAAPVFAGDPLQAPVGVAVSTDGRRLFVADTDAIFAIESSDAAPTPVRGTEGTAPRSLEIVAEGGQDTLYFTGKDARGAPAVFKMPASGAPAPVTVVAGPPLSSPDAVTATKAGVVYVTDRGPGTSGAGAVYRIVGGAAERIADIRPPVLAGVTLTLDESTLLVSTLSAEGTDQVLVIDVASLRSRVFDETIGANRQGGGLHRAHDVNVFAWADVIAGPDRRSRVYLLRP